MPSELLRVGLCRGHHCAQCLKDPGHTASMQTGVLEALTLRCPVPSPRPGEQTPAHPRLCQAWGTRWLRLRGPACDACEVVRCLSKLWLASGALWTLEVADGRDCEARVVHVFPRQRKGTSRAVSVSRSGLCSLAPPAWRWVPRLASSLPPPFCSPATWVACWPQKARHSGTPVALTSGPAISLCPVPDHLLRRGSRGCGGVSGPPRGDHFRITSHPILMRSVYLL